MKTIAFLTLTVASSFALADRVEENAQAIAYQGTWMPQTDAAASGGAYTVSSTANSTATYQFTGDSITIYRRLDTDGGTATITIDNKAWGSLSCFFPERRWQVPAVLDMLGAGTHTLVISVDGTTPNGSTGANIYLDAFENPTTFAPSAIQQSALTRLNQYRTGAGLPPAALSTAINLAAQGHSDYLVNNALPLGHTETQGTAGFVGTDFWDRMLYFGYDRSAFEDASPTADPVAAVDSWLSTVYHRLPLLRQSLVDVGFGGTTLNGNSASAMDFGNKSSVPTAARLVTIYPAANQIDVPLQMGNETPEPFPNQPSPRGFPVSVHIAQPATPTQGADTVANSGTLTDAGGTVIPTLFLDRGNDPSDLKFVKDDYFLVAKAPLMPSTTYTAKITGTDLSGNQFTATTTFTTITNATILNPSPFAATATSIFVQWETAGPVTATSLQYGTTTAYGTTLIGMPNNMDRPLSVGASIKGLTAGTTYHYQITATDAAGVTKTTPDLTFTTLNQ